MTVWTDEYVAGLECRLKIARAEAAEKLAEAWDKGAEFAIGYSVAPLYENPYRAASGVTE